VEVIVELVDTEAMIKGKQKNFITNKKFQIIGQKKVILNFVFLY